MDNSVSPESESLVSWLDVSRALDEVVARCEKTLDVFDQTLTLQGWQSRARCDALLAAMNERNVRIRVMLCDDHVIQSGLPRLVNLLKTHGHQLQLMVAENPPQSAANYVVADRQHILFRPNSVQSFGSMSWYDPYKSTTYNQTFNALWQQGGRRVFPGAFGL